MKCGVRGTNADYIVHNAVWLLKLLNFEQSTAEFPLMIFIPQVRRRIPITFLLKKNDTSIITQHRYCYMTVKSIDTVFGIAIYPPIAYMEIVNYCDHVTYYGRLRAPHFHLSRRVGRKQWKWLLWIISMLSWSWWFSSLLEEVSTGALLEGRLLLCWGRDYNLEGTVRVRSHQGHPLLCSVSFAVKFNDIAWWLH